METLSKDIGHSVRMFLRSPGFTITVVATITLGIAANTAVFSIVNAVLLKPVPFPDPDRLVMLTNTFAGGSGPGASPARFAHWRTQTSVLEDVAAFSTGTMNYTGGDPVEQVPSAQVSADYFRCFGAPIIRGRAFTTSEDLPGGPHLALVSENLWTRRFARDPDLVGKSIDLDHEPYTIIGIIGNRFDVREFGRSPDVWVPFQLDPNTTDQEFYFLVAARLKPGVSLQQAKAGIQFSAAAYRAKFPNSLGPKGGFSVVPLGQAFVGDARSSLLVLIGAVTFVLLIACANVANLLLVRATGRRREIAIRAAIGAGRGRIIRQLLTESVLLSLVGGLLGLGLGFVGIRALLSVSTADLPRVGEHGSAVGLDWRVVAFTVGLSLFTGLVFGLIPAVHGSRPDLGAMLKDSGRRSGTGFRQNKARSILVIAEVGLAVVLLVGSALLIRTVMALGAVDPGFDAKHVLTMSMSLNGPRYATSAAVAQLVRTGVERVRTVPGVVDASATCCVPLQGGFGLPFTIVGRPLEGSSTSTGGGAINAIAPGYFDVFKIPIKRGRAFTDRDDHLAPAVVIISEAMAKEYWKNGDPLRDRLSIGRGLMKELKDEPDRQIIGIVGDIRDRGLDNTPGSTMYIPEAQQTDASNALTLRIAPLQWVVRTQGDPWALAPSIEEQLREGTALPVADVYSMEEVMSLSTARQRLNMLLMTIFGCCAVVLAGIGIYGVMAYSVEQRASEMGIRVALGAEAGQVKGMVVMQGLGLAIVGVVLGIGSAFGLTRVLANFLFGVKAHDPVVFVLVPVLLSAVALAAVWIPASRASRIDPIEALRYE